MAYSYSPAPKPRRLRLVLIVLFVLLASGLAYWFINRNHKAEAPDDSQAQSQQETNQQPNYTVIDLQPAVQAWADAQAASYHIVVYDLQAGQNIAEVNPDEVLFAASLYKIYVAYLALLDFQTGAQNPDDILVAGQTMRECVDKMIRSSDSPCGEAMMAGMGQASLNLRVKNLGMNGTFFNGIRTSAADSARIIRLIAEKKDLNDENTAFLLDAMLTQDAKFKRGLATGAPQATWHTKVGWNEDINYHDIGLMTMPDGRKFAVAILGQGSGSSKPIADFASTIYTALFKDDVIYN
ncbi:MAG: serine hydrolase [Candidatus Saccharimonadales bacterium]